MFSSSSDMSVFPCNEVLFYQNHDKSLFLILFLSKRLGLLPLDGERNISKCGLVLSIIPIIVFLGSSLGWNLYCLFYVDSISLYKSLTIRLLYLIQIILQILCIFAHFIAICLYRNYFSNVFQISSKFGSKSKESKYSKYWTIIGIVFILTYYLTSHALLDQKWYHFCWFFSIAINEIAIYLILMQFCSLLELSATDLKIIKGLIRQNRKLLPLTNKHSAILETTGIINEIYSWQILIICTLVFINFVSFMFYLMQDVLTNSIKIALIPVRLFYCFWQVVNVYFIARSCETVSKKANSFNAELFRLMRESKTLCSNERLTLYVTMKPSIEFSACGFFSLGYPLVTSIIAAATTYLVILVQFSMPQNN